MRKVQPSPSWGIAGLLLAVVALIVVAGLPGRTVISVDDDPLPTDWTQRLTMETALVADKQATGGFKFAGARLWEKTYRLDLQFLGSSDCVGGVCDGPDGLTGEMMGITSDGDLIVGSRIEVSRACYDLIETTDPWPSVPECTVIAAD